MIVDDGCDDVKDRNHIMLSSQILDEYVHTSSFDIYCVMYTFSEEEDDSRTPSPPSQSETKATSSVAITDHRSSHQRDTVTKDMFKTAAQKQTTTPIVSKTTHSTMLPPQPTNNNNRSTSIASSTASKSRRSEPLRPSTTADFPNRQTLTSSNATTTVSSTKPTSSSGFRFVHFSIIYKLTSEYAEL